MGYFLSILALGLLYALLAIGLTLEYGETGLINFGHVAFFAIGAYVAGICSRLSMAPWETLIIAAALASLLAVPIGVVALRLRDDYFAIFTLGFAEAVRVVIEQWESLTNGVQGIAGIPSLFGSGTGANAVILMVVLLLVIVAVAIAATHRLQHSGFGRVLRAIRDNEEAVVAVGKNPAWFKIKTIVWGSLLAGLSGGLFAYHISYISPMQVNSLVTFYAWMAIIIGGLGSMRGALLGSCFLVLLIEGARFIGDWLPGVSAVTAAQLRLGVVGLLLIVFSLFRPQGIFHGRDSIGGQ